MKHYDSHSVKTKPIEPILRHHLLILVDAYCKATERKVGSVARNVHGTASFFDNLKKSAEARDGDRGVSFTLRIYDQVIERLAMDWPKGTPFPTLQDASNQFRKAKRRTQRAVSKDIAALAG